MLSPLTITSGNLKKLLATVLFGGLAITSFQSTAISVTEPKALYQVIRSFDGNNDGGDPYGVGMTQGADGSFYGTTLSGGKLANGDYGSGTVYKIDARGRFYVLHVFDGVTGAYPTAAVSIAKDGSLYGTTTLGGKDKNNTGIVYKIDPTGKFSVVHNFDFAREGRTSSEVAIGADGSLYGTTYTYGTGVAVDPATIYKIDVTGRYRVLHRFNQAAQELPVDSVTIGKDGSLYGVTNYGGQLSKGTIYKLEPNGKYKVLHYFKTPYQSVPNAGVILDANGSVYGTTNGGGAFNHGTLYKVDANGKYQIIHHFNGANGMQPKNITLAKDGSLYGIADTLDNSNIFTQTGPSILYQVKPNLAYKILHKFSIDSGVSKLAITSKGNLYGTERQGGQYERGKIFRIGFVPQVTVNLSAMSTSVASGQAVTLTAKVAAASSTGLVGFIEATGGISHLYATYVNQGTATFSSASLTPGKHTIYAQYSNNDGVTTGISNPLIINVTNAN